MQLARWFGSSEVQLGAALPGHTNQSHLVFADGGRYVLRRSWRGKPVEQLEREAAVLDALRAWPVPRLLETRDGARFVVADGQALQLFHVRDGDRAPRWFGSGDGERMRAAMAQLARLHGALAPLPAAPGDPLRWLRARHERVAARSLASLPVDAPAILRRIDALLAARAPAPLQWLHGDYHLGNLLWRGDELAAVVDFDDSDRGAPASEALLALFALSRTSREDHFEFDRALWDIGFAAYAALRGAPVLDCADLEALFCAYQVLIHLEAAQRGLWPLAPGIGFWPCWNFLARQR